MPITGVGMMPTPLVSLYRLTLPLTTGTPSASHASASPSIASLSCQ